MQNPSIQTLSSRARTILGEGAVYTFGRDRQSRPVVFLDLAKTHFDRYELGDYYCAINAVLNVVVDVCFVPGVVEQYLFVIDMGGQNFTSLRVDAIGSIIRKLSTVYSMYLGALLVINAQTFVRFTYAALSIFIHEETRKKITLLSCKELYRMADHVDPSQLYRKHGGLHADPDNYWPPQVPGAPRAKPSEEDTIYYSIEGNESLFRDSTKDQMEPPQEEHCCHNHCNELCRIF
jgi:hypothetical protein